MLVQNPLISRPHAARPVLVQEYDSGIEPVTLNDVKVFLRLDVDVPNDEEPYANEKKNDVLLRSFIAVARKQAESICRRAFTEQIWSFHLSEWPEFSVDKWQSDRVTKKEIRLAKPPVHEVHVLYRKPGGDWAMVDRDVYVITHDLVPYVQLVDGEGWPVKMAGEGTIRVTFSCGLYRGRRGTRADSLSGNAFGNAALSSLTGDSPVEGEDNVPEEVKQWIRLKVGELYEHRERSNTDKVSVKDFVDCLLDPWIVPDLSYVGW